jgi:hypothetical protein
MKMKLTNQTRNKVSKSFDVKTVLVNKALFLYSNQNEERLYVSSEVNEENGLKARGSDPGTYPSSATTRYVKPPSIRKLNVCLSAVKVNLVLSEGHRSKHCIATALKLPLKPGAVASAKTVTPRATKAYFNPPAELPAMVALSYGPSTETPLQEEGARIGNKQPAHARNLPLLASPRIAMSIPATGKDTRKRLCTDSRRNEGGKRKGLKQQLLPRVHLDRIKLSSPPLEKFQFIDLDCC